MQISKQTFLWAGLIILVGVIAVSCSLFDRNSSESPTMPEMTPASVDLSNLSVGAPKDDALGAGVEVSQFCVNVPGGMDKAIYEIQYKLVGGGTFCTTLDGYGVNSVIGLKAGDTLDWVNVNQYSLLGLLTSAVARINNVDVLSVPGDGKSGCVLSKAGKVPGMTYNMVTNGSVAAGVSTYACTSAPTPPAVCPFYARCVQRRCQTQQLPVGICEARCERRTRPQCCLWASAPAACSQVCATPDLNLCIACTVIHVGSRAMNQIIRECRVR